MTPFLHYQVDSANDTRIGELLRQCDSAFVPPLSSRVDLADYAGKLVANALRLEAWSGDVLVGLLAVYCNNLDSRQAFLTNLCILPSHAGKGIASELMARCIHECTARGMREIGLEVSAVNAPALRLYERWQFKAVKRDEATVTMRKNLQGKDSM